MSKIIKTVSYVQSSYFSISFLQIPPDTEVNSFPSPLKGFLRSKSVQSSCCVVSIPLNIFILL